MEKSCLECGEPLRGRIDKKFCTDFCRNAYNNRLNCNINNYVRNVNYILKKNRRILEAMIMDNVPKIQRSRLIELGFNFQYCTHREVLGKNAILNYCYDIGYLQSEKDLITVVKRHEVLFQKYDILSVAEPHLTFSTSAKK